VRRLVRRGGDQLSWHLDDSATPSVGHPPGSGCTNGTLVC
jgi:hypothetical protein